MSEKKIVMGEFPGNSNVRKKARNVRVKPSEPEVKKIVKGNVSRRKKSFFQRAGESLVGESTHSVGEYILYDILIPAAKKTFVEIMSGGSEVLAYGDTRGSRTYRDRERSYVSYSRYSDDRRRPYDRDEGRDGRSYSHARGRASDNIIFDSRGDAEEVLSGLVDLVDEYGVARVSDMNEMCGVTGDYTDDRWGWYNLREASVARVRDGYILDLPKARPIEN